MGTKDNSASTKHYTKPGFAMHKSQWDLQRGYLHCNVRMLMYVY